MATANAQPSFLATRRGKLTLALLAAIAFLDFVDASIVNIAPPSIRRALHFSVQSLVWVPSGYLLTYGGFMLLGGRAADLLGRRRVLIAGVVVIGVSSLIGGFAEGSGVLVLGGIYKLIADDRRRARLANFDALGAVLATCGMLLLVFALVKAPTVGWGTARTIAELAGALALLAAFVINELRVKNPLAP